MFFTLYLIYLTILITFIYSLLNLFLYLKIYNDIVLDLQTIELLQKLDSLLFQKEEHLQKISDLQDQLSVILLSIQKKPAHDVIFDFLSNNSSFFVSISFFIVTLAIVNFFSKYDLEILTSEIIKTQQIAHDSHIAITKEALTTATDIILNDITKLLIRADLTFTLNSDKKIELLFKKLSYADKINIEILVQKINEISLKTQAIDEQLLQILDLLSKSF